MNNLFSDLFLFFILLGNNSNNNNAARAFYCWLCHCVIHIIEIVYARRACFFAMTTSTTTASHYKVNVEHVIAFLIRLYSCVCVFMCLCRLYSLWNCVNSKFRKHTTDSIRLKCVAVCTWNMHSQLILLFNISTLLYHHASFYSTETSSRGSNNNMHAHCIQYAQQCKNVIEIFSVTNRALNAI